MFAKTILAAAVLAMIAAAPAQACVGCGIKFNGVSLNGITFNGPGVVLQGTKLNGISFNGPGVVLQGRTLNGISLQGPMLQGIQFNGMRVNSSVVSVGGKSGGLNGKVVAIEF